MDSHTQVLESGVHPYPHNGLVCSSRLGGGTKTQEVPYTGRARLPDSLPDLKRQSVPHWCVFTRVGTSKSKGESAQRRGLFSPESLPSLEKAPVSSSCNSWALQTLSLVSQLSIFLLWFIQEESRRPYTG